MAIPESQLETWAHQGSITQSSNTYNTIKNKLEAVGNPYAGKSYKVLLQGSYGNDTNIYAESDVDIVIKLNDCFRHDLNELSDDQKAAFKAAHSGASECIANYPKQHSANCTAKHQATNEWFKPMVRVLKNLRGKLIENKMIEAGVAPSYYIEGLLYNVPNEKFGESYDDSFVNCINWIMDADRSKFLCANRQYYLLREGSPVTWRDSKCTEFLTAACDLWKQW